MFSALVLVACGNGDDLSSEADVFTPPPTVDEPSDGDTSGDVRPEPEPLVAAPPVMDPGTDGTDESPVTPAVSDGSPCALPDRVSGTPQTIEEALVLMNALPKPTTLACFLESLERPLSLYMTSSGASLQPSPGARSPRTFIVNGPLVMSIVFEGEAAATLELGYRTSAARSVKTEILFPLQREFAMINLFDRVQRGTGTQCGACHTGEIRTDHEAFPMEVFESDVIVPSSVFEVELESLRAEAASCDPEAEERRCTMLEALFGHGEVRPSEIFTGQL